MKKFVFLMLFLGALLHLIAQPADVEENQEKVKTLKIGFLTKRLNLTSEEAQKFWPVYNQFTEEMEKVKGDTKLMHRAVQQGFQTMTDKEVETLADEFVAQRRKEADILEKYHKQFRQVLPIRKVAMLYKSERDFKRELLKQLRDAPAGGGRLGMKGRR
ncbi:MAG: hypothetical protein ACKVTZ_13835 [Bacteroidia bacterium]